MVVANYGGMGLSSWQPLLKKLRVEKNSLEELKE